MWLEFTAALDDRPRVDRLLAQHGGELVRTHEVSQTTRFHVAKFKELRYAKRFVRDYAGLTRGQVTSIAGV